MHPGRSYVLPATVRAGVGVSGAMGRGGSGASAHQEVFRQRVQALLLGIQRRRVRGGLRSQAIIGWRAAALHLLFDVLEHILVDLAAFGLGSECGVEGVVRFRLALTLRRQRLVHCICKAARLKRHTLHSLPLPLELAHHLQRPRRPRATSRITIPLLRRSLCRALAHVALRARRLLEDDGRVRV